MNAQAGMSLRSAHLQYCRKYCVPAQLFCGLLHIPVVNKAPKALKIKFGDLLRFFTEASADKRYAFNDRNFTSNKNDGVLI